MEPRVALLGMILESNRFAKPAGEKDFRSLTWLEGSALMDEARSPTPALAAEFSSFVRAMDATGPWHPLPCLLAASHPAGPVEETVFETALARMEAALRDAGPLDAVYICNHGAMVAAHLDDPDGEMVDRIRRIVGATPILVMTLDLHANLSQRMVDATDLIIGYRTNPHVDMIERGEEAAFSLRRILATGERPASAMVKPPIAPASVTLLTAESPYGTAIDHGQRRQAELGAAVLNVSVFGGFIFSDTPDCGLSVVVTARRDPTVAQDLAEEIAEFAWVRRAGFRRELMPIGEAVAMAGDTERPPVIFSDAGDNPGGGGSGRTTELLSALHAASAAGVLYGSFHDPALADEAHALGEGARFTARFNRSRRDTSWERWDCPFAADAEVLSLGDGNVVGEQGMTAGRRMVLGRTAALRLDGIVVVVISDRRQTADPVFFHMLQLDIGKAHTVVVKSRGHFRAGFASWFPPAQVKEVDTGGLTSPVLERWPMENVPRPSYPLDPDADWRR